MTPDYDITIIGGGLAGLSLAAALAPLPLSVLMVESRPPLTDLAALDERSLALGFGSRLIYGGIGIWDEIAASTTPIETVHVSEQERLGATRLRADEVGAAALGHVVTLRALTEALERRVADLANITRWHETRLTGIDTNGEKATLTLENHDGKQSVTTALLVGADGGASSSRRLLGIGSRVEDYGQTAVIANVTTAQGHGNVAFERFTRSGPMALLPLAGGRSALVWSLPPQHAERIMALDDDAFLAELPRHFGHRLGRFTATGPREAFPLKMTLADKLTAPRGLLLGNAAHALHPIAGQGLNLGLRDVAVLAELLARFDDPGDEMLLATYQQWRAPDIAATAKASDGLLRLFTNPWPPLAHLRGAGLIALDRLPPLKRRLARLGMGFRHPLQGPLFHGRALTPQYPVQEGIR